MRWDDIMQQNIKFLPAEKQSCYFLLDYYNQRNPIGKVYNYQNGYAEVFSLTSLLKSIELMTDAYQNSENRFFIEPDEKNNDIVFTNQHFDIKENYGHIATFKISVLFSQRNSWQGVITWIEKDMSLCFRSVYELINLIDNVAVSSDKQTHEYKMLKI